MEVNDVEAELGTAQPQLVLTFLRVLALANPCNPASRKIGLKIFGYAE